MATNPPGVFVSSTFYDLMQIRRDIGDFIESVGYRPLLSEYQSFPVDPNTTTVENCKRRVEQEGDIFVLVIGGRYGSTADKSAKSVTNLEYLTARAKGIPVFAFVEKRVLAVLPVWEKNPQADFSGVVDTANLFEFIRQVRDQDSVWMREFECAADIIGVLRIQWAYLMGRGLRLVRCVDARGAELAALDGLRGDALRIAIEKPPLWEYKLFGHALTDVVAAHADARREHALGIIHPPREQVGEVLDWVSARLDEGKAIGSNLETLLNVAFPKAAGPPGQPGSVADLAFVARNVGRLYRSAIDWSQRVSGAYISEENWRPVVHELARFLDNVIEQVEAFGARVVTDIAAAEGRLATQAGPVAVKTVLKIDVTNLEGFNRELAKLKAKLGLPDDE